MPQTRLTVKGKEYVFDMDKELTVGRLRQIKHTFRDLGTYGSFFRGLQDLDPEAMLCAAWLAQLAAGEPNVKGPNEIADFNLDEWNMGPADEPQEDEDADPPTQAATPTTASTTETPTNSGTDGSGSSPDTST